MVLGQMAQGGVRVRWMVVVVGDKAQGEYMKSFYVTWPDPMSLVQHLIRLSLLLSVSLILRVMEFVKRSSLQICPHPHPKGMWPWRNGFGRCH